MVSSPFPLEIAMLTSRIAHELLGQLGKSETTWTPSIISSSLMKEIILALEGNTINGKLEGDP